MFSTEFSFLDTHVQTREFAWRVLLIFFTVTSGVVTGWLFSAYPRKSQEVYSAANRLTASTLRYYLYAITAIIMGSMVALALPGFVWQVAYHRGMEPPLGIGVFPVFALFALLGLVAHHVSLRSYSRVKVFITVAIIIYVIFVCMLFRGARLDVTGFFLALLTLAWIKSTRQSIKATIVLATLLTLLGMHTWGLYRALASPCRLSFIDIALVALTKPWNASCPELMKSESQSESQSEKNIIPNQPNNYAVVISTLGNVAVSLYQLMGAIRDGSTAFQLGASYIDYIPRTLPAFIYPERPLDFTIENVNLGLGSLYFLTEAYANFGLFGVGAIGVLMGWVFGAATKRLRADGTFQSTFVFLILYSLLIRVTWYQFFGFYKALISWFLIEVIIFLLIRAQALLNDHKKKLIDKFSIKPIGRE